MDYSLISDHFGLQAYRRFFPHFTPNIFQQEMIEANVSDSVAWDETLHFWAINDYRPQSVGKMLDYYADVVKNRKGIASYTYVHGQPTQREAIAEEQARLRADIEAWEAQKTETVQ